MLYEHSGNSNQNPIVSNLLSMMLYHYTTPFWSTDFWKYIRL